MNMKDMLDVVTAVASAIAASGIALTVYQITNLRKWNKMTCAFQHLPPNHELNDLEVELNESIVRLIDRISPLTEAEVGELMSHQQLKTRVKLKNYLNMLEGYCAAVNFGIIDDKVAKALYKFKFERHLDELLPYIAHVRTIWNNPRFMCELEAVVGSWRDSPQPKPKY